MAGNRGDITFSFSRIPFRDHSRFASMQNMVLFRNEANAIIGELYEIPDNLQFATIISIYIAPEFIKTDTFKPYILIAFDYIRGHDLRAVVKVSQRTSTAHFKELVSWN